MLQLFVADLKLLVRNRQRLFWSLMFPLIFTVIFGAFFGKNSGGSGTVSLINHSQTELAQSLEKAMKDSGLFKIAQDKTESESRDELKKNQITAIVIIPDRFGDPAPDAPKNVTMIIDPANLQSNSVVTAFLDQYLTQANFSALGSKPIFGVSQENTSTQSFSYFDFVLIGLIGMALMNSSIQGVAISMSQYREDKILKRMTTTPIPSWQFILAEVLSRLVLNVVQVAMILAVGVYVFSGHVYGNLAIIFGLSLLGGILFQMIGFMIASVAKTTQGAEGMSTAITIPMMFLAGVFFPIDQLPKWLYAIVQYLPLAPLLHMIRAVGLESSSPFSNPIDIALVLGWILITAVIASLRFRMSEE